MPDMPRFAGWYRPTPWSTWGRVVEAPTEAAAWKLLLDRAPAGGEKAVLPNGKHPSDGRGLRMVQGRGGAA